MNLAFKTQIDGKPTYFPEKILRSLQENCEIDIVPYLKELAKHTDLSDSTADLIPKDHTFRLDSKNRWKEDNNIHYIINNRTPERFQFAPVMKVTCIQFFEFKHVLGFERLPRLIIRNRSGHIIRSLHPDNHFEYLTEIDNIAKRDGFPSWDEFLGYFREDCSGKIIHWTHNSY